MDQLLFDTDGDVLYEYINTELIPYLIVKHWQVALLHINCISKFQAVAIKYPLRLISVGLQIAAFGVFQNSETHRLLWKPGRLLPHT